MTEHVSAKCPLGKVHGHLEGILKIHVPKYLYYEDSRGILVGNLEEKVPLQLLGSGTAVAPVKVCSRTFTFVSGQGLVLVALALAFDYLDSHQDQHEWWIPADYPT